MPRKIRRGNFTIDFTAVCGASDATTLLRGEAAVASVGPVSPFDNVTFLGASVVQRVAGTGAGTFSIALGYGATPTQISETSAATFITAAAAVGTVHGYLDGQNTIIPSLAQFKITTVKTGTVSADATLTITALFGIS